YIELNDKMSSTHTFTVISADKIIYIESAYGKIQGVWEARSLQDIFNFILKNMFEDDGKQSTFQIYQFESPINKYGMNTLQYMDYIKKNGKKINHKYNPQKPVISLTESLINEDFHKDAESYREVKGDSLVDVIIKMDLENLADKMDSFTEEEAIVQLLGSYKRKGYDTHLLMEFRDRYKNVLRWIRKKKDIIDPQEYIDYKNNQLKEIPKSKIKEIEKKVVAQQGSLPDRFGVIESNLLLEVVNTKKIYHLSQSNLDGKTLNPSIPDNFMTKNGYEDAKTPRISFAKSIDGCLRGLSQKCTNMELYVHEPIVDKNVKIKNISNHDVPDASITGETWITTPVKVKCIGKIKVIGDKGEKGIPYKYGNKTAELYNWNWKWVNRVSESYNEYIIESDNSIGYMTQTSISNDIFLRCKLDGIQKYMETVDVECVDEMSVSNKIDNEFQKKEKINISKIQKVKLDERIIDKYESGNPSLKHLRISNDYTGYFYLYNNKPVGYINVNKDTHTAQAMELFKDFQGMGLSDDLLKDAKTLKADNLTVNKNNEVAIDIYKKNGFRTYKSTDNMLFMKLNSSKIQQIKEFNDVMIVYPDCLEESYINEASGNANNVLLRKLMYAERFRTPKEVFAIYDQVKADFPWISKTYLTYDRYMMYNMFIDLSFYNQTFFKNNIYKLDKGVDLYFDFVNRFLNDARLLKASYTNRTVIIPVNDWKSEGNIWMYNEDVNPISMITRLAMKDPEKFRNWAGINFVFMSDNAYFKIDFATFDKKSLPLFLTLIKKLKNNEQPIDDPTDNITDSKQAIVADIIDKIETSQKIKINNLTGNSGEITKDELVQKVTQAASISTDVEQTLDELDKDAKLKEIIAALGMEEDNTIKLNAARTVRMTQLNDEFLNKEINKKPIRDLLKEPE
ncbi:MAG: GNAT family N-acetyltransferase, partial [Bacilli bacterium]|nr:GNAT family N-acetyltransferase [Bacilli bacterium]